MNPTLESEIAFVTVALQAGTDVVIVADAAGSVTYVNDAFRRLAGCADDVSLVGRELASLVSSGVGGSDSDGVTLLDLSLAACGAPVEELVRFDGNGGPCWVTLRITPVLDVAGEVIRIVAVGRDVTAARTLEAALRASEARFRSLVEHASDAIIVVDADGTAQYASPSDERVFGLPAEQRVGTHAFERVHPDDRHTLTGTFRELVAEPGRTAAAEFRVRHADGSWRHVAAVTENRLHDPAVRGIVISSRDVTARTSADQALRESEARFRHQALHDPLTGLANRTLFVDRVTHALARSARDGTTATVLFLDLDGFKEINDTLGHAAGDRCLVATADRLRGVVRAGDTVARLGGDEFAVLLEGAQGTPAAHAPAAAVEVAERVVAALGAPIQMDAGVRSLAASIGIAAADGAASPDDLLRRADHAMYVAKARGGGRHTVAETIAASLRPVVAD